MCAKSLRKAPRLQWIDLHERLLARQRRLQPTMIGPRRLKHDARHLEGGQPFLEGAQALCRILEPSPIIRLQMECIEVGFGNVDPDVMLRHLRLVLSLSCVIQTRVSVQALG